MTAHNSATHPTTIAVTSPVATSPLAGSPSRGTILASLGVLAFSLTFPSTVWGLQSFGPWSLVSLRSVLAAVIAAGFLIALRVPLPAASTGWGSPSSPAGW